MKNLVTSLLGLAFVIVGCNIANIMGYNPPTNLQTVAASTVQQPMDHLFDQVKITNPDTVHDTIKVETPVPCNHKSQPAKTVIKRTVIKKTDTSYVPLLWIAEPNGDMTDSVTTNTHTYSVRKGELSDVKQIISKVCK